jgi:hypothetical protein
VSDYGGASKPDLLMNLGDRMHPRNIISHGRKKGLWLSFQAFHVRIIDTWKNAKLAHGKKMEFFGPTNYLEIKVQKGQLKSFIISQSSNYISKNEIIFYSFK